MEKDTINLKKVFADTCEKYLQVFCKNYGFQYEPDSWVAGDVGTIACASDYFFDFCDVIKYCVDNELNDCDELIGWYDYTLFAHECGMSIPNFKSWHMGCPRMKKEEQDRIIETRKLLDELIEEAKENYNNSF